MTYPTYEEYYNGHTDNRGTWHRCPSCGKADGNDYRYVCGDDCNCDGGNGCPMLDTAELIITKYPCPHCGHVAV